jgi:hypothetical protein
MKNEKTKHNNNKYTATKSEKIFIHAVAAIERVFHQGQQRIVFLQRGGRHKAAAAHTAKLPAKCLLDGRVVIRAARDRHLRDQAHKHCPCS